MLQNVVLLAPAGMEAGRLQPGAVLLGRGEVQQTRTQSHRLAGGGQGP